MACPVEINRFIGKNAFSFGGRALHITEERSSDDFGNDRRFTWGMLLLGLTAGIVTLQIFVVRPMERQLKEVKQELAAVESNMDKLVAVRDQVWETNSLLTSLNTQYSQLGDARTALSGLRQFRREVEAAAHEAEAAYAALDRFQSLQGTVLEQGQATAPAYKVLKDMIRLHEELIAHQPTNEQAIAASNGLIDLKTMIQEQAADADEAKAGLQQLTELKSQVLTGSEQVANAQDGLDRLVAVKSQLVNEAETLNETSAAVNQFIALKNSINEQSANVDAARQTADQLLALKEEIVLRGGQTDTARENVEKFFNLRDDLIGEKVDTAQAEQNLAAFLRIESQLSERTDHLTDAIHTLELLSGFQEAVEEHVQSLDAIRRNLMDIVLLESTVARAVRGLEPLTQLGHLRRMSDAEVRDAARIILDQRSTRIGDNSVKADEATTDTADAVVPEPVEVK